jgi:hypothetical protein
VATPEYLSDDEACTLQVAAMTAWMAMNGTRPLGSPGGKGEVILIQGTGGVSINGLLIAKASGAEGTSFQPLTIHHLIFFTSHNHLQLRRQTRPRQSPRRRPHHKLPFHPHLGLRSSPPNLRSRRRHNLRKRGRPHNRKIIQLRTFRWAD